MSGIVDPAVGHGTPDGGGIATEEQATAYLTGEWSERLGFAPMPVDAVFLGTRLMACKEACTSDAVKHALARAPGSDEWPLDGQAAGEVTSGRSQLDASIYYLDNDAAKAGRLLDEVAGDAKKVAARKSEIVKALSSTAKPYFGDLEEMSYAEVLQRFVELTCIGRGSAYEDGPWPDLSFRRRFEDLLRRADAALYDSKRAGRTPRRVQTDRCAPRLARCNPPAACGALPPQPVNRPGPGGREIASTAREREKRRRVRWPRKMES